jgi:hypothetical protein
MGMHPFQPRDSMDDAMNKYISPKHIVVLCWVGGHFRKLKRNNERASSF